MLIRPRQPHIILTVQFLSLRLLCNKRNGNCTETRHQQAPGSQTDGKSKLLGKRPRCGAEGRRVVGKERLLRHKQEALRTHYLLLTFRRHPGMEREVFGSQKI